MNVDQLVQSYIILLFSTLEESLLQLGKTAPMVQHTESAEMVQHTDSAEMMHASQPSVITPAAVAPVQLKQAVVAQTVAPVQQPKETVVAQIVAPVQQSQETVAPVQPEAAVVAQTVALATMAAGGLHLHAEVAYKCIDPHKTRVYTFCNV